MWCGVDVVWGRIFNLDKLVRIDEMSRLKIRPNDHAEVDTLLGDPSKAKEQLGWEPEISFEDLVKEMVKADLEEAKKDELCQRAGFYVCNYNE